MTYGQTLKYLYDQLPMFHRIGAAAYKANLDNTHALMNLLDHPYNSFVSIHIAGTNGKGSTSHMLASILQHAGYQVGLYTSPHLKDFRERIKINGKMISRKAVCDFVVQYKNEFDKIQPSFFEWTVALAFDYFKKKKVEIAIIETGLGGRLDSTNVITPLVAVITNISFDHQHLLGNTLVQIATEKAGIIKENVPVIIGASSKQTDQVFKTTARLKNAEIKFADKIYKPEISRKNISGDTYLFVDIYRNKKRVFKNLKLDLTGSYQLKNIQGVLLCIDLIRQKFPVSRASIYSGLKSVKETTGLMGRWQVLSKKPMVICDTGHNVSGVAEVLKNIKQTPHRKLHFVLGMVNDKDIDQILKLLPVNAVYYFCKANIPRGYNAELLRVQAQRFKLKGSAYTSVKKAINAARKSASIHDMIFIGGSTFTVAEAL